MKKLNCWEYMKCGREPNGSSVKENGVCPAAKYNELNKTHGGINAGRSCWIVAGSMCHGTIQGTYALKYLDCIECDFYAHVKQEEAWKFEGLGKLLLKIKDINA